MAERQASSQTNRGERKFALLKRPKRIWAVASIHGEAKLLKALHEAIGERWEPLDRIVYLGNMIGRGPEVVATLDELVAFRRELLAVPHAIPDDIVYLRGSQEEMWQKLLQLQFSNDPSGVLKWMLAHGLEATLTAYGGVANEGLQDARGGALQLTRWTTTLRESMQRHPGHFQVLSELRRAAHDQERRLLFVNAGVDPARPLEAQSDSFWWGHPGFQKLTAPFDGFALTVRGFDLRRPGIEELPHALTIDGGAGFGGKLLAICLSADGNILERLEIAPD